MLRTPFYRIKVSLRVSDIEVQVGSSFVGQGGGQAIEDATSLGALLPIGTLSRDVPERLSLYNECRYTRAHQIQEYTRLAGRDAREFKAEDKELNSELSLLRLYG